MAEYLLFVDDSGNREYDEARNYTTSGRTRYFVYGAFLAPADDVSRFATAPGGPGTSRGRRDVQGEVCPSVILDNSGGRCAP